MLGRPKICRKAGSGMGGQWAKARAGKSPQDAIKRAQQAESRLKEAQRRLNYTNSASARNAMEEAEKAAKAARAEADKRQNQRQGVADGIQTFVQKQVGVDLRKYTTEKTRKMGGGVVIDWKGMPKTEQRRVLEALRKYDSRYTIEDWSAWQKIIRRRKASEPF